MAKKKVVAEEAAEEVAHIEPAVDGEAVDTRSAVEKLLDGVAVGSTLERAGHGWDIRIATPGVIQKMHGSGATIVDAFASIGTVLPTTDA